MCIVKNYVYYLFLFIFIRVKIMVIVVTRTFVEKSTRKSFCPVLDIFKLIFFLDNKPCKNMYEKYFLRITTWEFLFRTTRHNLCGCIEMGYEYYKSSNVAPKHSHSERSCVVNLYCTISDVIQIQSYITRDRAHRHTTKIFE